MLYCNKCNKRVEIFGVSSGAPDADKIVQGMQEHAEKEGFLILFNPPMFPDARHNCPVCSTALVDKEE